MSVHNKAIIDLFAEMLECQTNIFQTPNMSLTLGKISESSLRVGYIHLAIQTVWHKVNSISISRIRCIIQVKMNGVLVHDDTLRYPRRQFLYEPCPSCRINQSACWPAVQCATIVLRLPIFQNKCFLYNEWKYFKYNNVYAWCYIVTDYGINRSQHQDW